MGHQTYLTHQDDPCCVSRRPTLQKALLGILVAHALEVVLQEWTEMKLFVYVGGKVEGEVAGSWKSNIWVIYALATCTSAKT